MTRLLSQGRTTDTVKSMLAPFLLALAMALPVAAHHGKDGGLTPREAFQVRAEPAGDAIRFAWVIADGHFLLRNQFRFVIDSPGVSPGEPRVPPGTVVQDPFFGAIEVFTDKVTVELPLTFDGQRPSEIQVRATSLGCREGGNCFGPLTETLRVVVPPAAPPPVARSDRLDFSPVPGSEPLSLLSRLRDSLAGAQSGDQFLPPDEAFVLRTDVRDAHTVVARWEMPETYYLYRDKFNFALRDSRGVALEEAVIPPGKVKTDEYFGRVEVYYDEAIATIPLRRQAKEPMDITLDVGYQGCTDRGLCYPPMTKSVALALPAAFDVPKPDTGSSQPTQGPQLAQQPVGELPEQDLIARSLAKGTSWTVLAVFFGFGLLLTFTPCVLPMIPILSSIIVGQGENITTRKAFTLSLVFVLAMAATYTAAGVLAGLFGAGANLQSASQDPWILSAFVVVFVLLALAMFGLYGLQLPASWQAKLAQLSNRQQGGTYIGVGIMGFLSALIVGPCVAAPLAGALIYIGQTGDALLGGAALFALSMGMGAPVLAAGTVGGKLLPRAGPWMAAVKAVFGVLLLGVAIYLLERIVPGWVTLLLWGALLVMGAIYLGALDALEAGVSGWRRLSKGAGLVALVYGVALMVGALAGGSDVFKPLEGLTTSGAGAERRSLVFKPVKGIDGLKAELRAASAQGRPVMLDFYADWCVSCKELEKYTFSDPGVQAALADAVLLQTDVTANDAEDQALLNAFGLFGPPAILFFGSDGEERPEYRVVGFVKAAPFRAHVLKAMGTARGVQASARESASLAAAEPGRWERE